MLGRRPLRAMPEDRIGDGIEFPRNLMIPEAQRQIILLRKPCVARRIAAGARAKGVLFAVYFHDDFGFMADEIGDGRPDRRRTAKMQFGESMAARFNPQTRLGVGHIATQSFRLPARFRRDVRMRQYPLPDPPPQGGRGRPSAMVALVVAENPYAAASPQGEGENITANEGRKRQGQRLDALVLTPFRTSRRNASCPLPSSSAPPGCTTSRPSG